MKYLVKLKPLDKFFFGKNQTFGDDNYFAKSSYLPQQTQLLGMLRKEILIQNDFITQKRRGEWVDKNRSDDAKKYVGAKRFDISSSQELDLGAIKEISPIFLVDKDDTLSFFTAQDLGIKLDSINDGIPKLKFRDNDNLYNEKAAKTISQKLISKNGKHSLGEVFIQDDQVGIIKSRTGASDDNAFFKKTSYKLDKKFCFAFVLELSDEIDIKLNNAVVSLGGERSSFKLIIDKEHDLCDTYLAKMSDLYEKEKFDKLILLSDTFINDTNHNIFKHSCFALTDTVAVKTIDAKVTKVKESEENREKYKDYRFKKSDIYNFFKQGSVFYKPTQELENLIKKNNNLQKIGYNKYTIIKGDTK